MDDTTVIEICRTAIITSIMVMGPILVIMMIVGTTISVFQTITSINEQTLAMVRKVLVVFGVSILLMPYMLSEMQEYFEREIIDRIVAIGAEPVRFDPPPPPGRAPVPLPATPLPTAQ